MIIDCNYREDNRWEVDFLPEGRWWFAGMDFGGLSKWLQEECRVGFYCCRMRSEFNMFGHRFRAFRIQQPFEDNLSCSG